MSEATSGSSPTAEVSEGKADATETSDHFVQRYRSRPASWVILWTGESRYSRTVRVPRWISALTSMPGTSRGWRPWLSRWPLPRLINAR